MSDLEILTRLNEGYIRSVQESDIKWFGGVLTEDFLNTNPDGSLSVTSPDERAARVEAILATARARKAAKAIDDLL